MGQVPSSASTSPEPSHRGISSSQRLDSLPSLEELIPSFDEDEEEGEEGGGGGGGGGGYDYTGDLPDECLAHVFHFLGTGDRKRCSAVCRRWLRVDGESRHRLSLNARAELLPSLPSVFARFDAVAKLALRCDRKSISLGDEALVLISFKCRSLTRLKLRGCRELTDLGVAAFAENCTRLRKLSCGSCSFGARAINAVLDHCVNLEELSIKRLRGIHDGAEPIGPGAAAKSLRSICLKELINGQCFAPLLVGARKLSTLKLIRCLGDWDNVLQTIGGSNPGLLEVHLERIQVSDCGLSGIANCKGIETLHVVKVPECSNLGLSSIAENCRQLRKLHIDGWRINRIGDEGLVEVAKQCLQLQELVLIGVGVTHSSLGLIGSNCRKLERLAFCGSNTVRDAEIACIAAKCEALKKLCIKNFPVSDVGIESLSQGCPNLVKIKVKCRGMSGQVVELLKERRGSLVFNLDACEIEAVDDIGVQESAVEFPPANASDVPSGSNERSMLYRAKLGLFAGRNLVACTFRRWSNGENSSNGKS
ncbi:F-box protein SKIP2 [Syzygium oleosum]|uniref:F-box protein SKIP2 n=1 Tax=Syzygium oleosum TaxID=219896 RepID=UPI0024B87F28|nr:F-box protein SKIP2 [Syzygium oleosum]